MAKKISRITHRIIERHTIIHKEIANGTYPSLKDLCKRTFSSSATICRDIEFLRDRCAAPIAYDKIMNGYYYTEKNFVPTFILTSDTPGRSIPLKEGFSREEYAKFVDLPTDLILKLETCTDLGEIKQSHFEMSLTNKYCGRSFLHGYMWIGLRVMPSDFSQEYKLTLALWEKWGDKKHPATRLMQALRYNYFAENTSIDDGYWLYTILDKHMLEASPNLLKKEFLKILNEVKKYT